MMKNRSGFSLIDLMIGISITGIILAAAMSVVVQHRRIYTLITDAAAAEGTLSHLAAATGAELLPLNAVAGDLIHAGADSMAIRLFMGAYYVCQVTTSPVSFTVLRLTVAGSLQSGDSAVVYSAGPSADFTDDLWELVSITSVSAATCPDGSAGVTVVVDGITDARAGAVPSGAPFRAFTHASYSFQEKSNGWYIVQSNRNFAGFPVAGPLEPPGGNAPGLEFRYFDADGDTTTVESAVARVEIVAIAGRSLSGTRHGDPVTVSRTLSFKFRNN